MRNTVAILVLFAVSLWASGIFPAIVPALVPAANKSGNSKIFQLESGTATSGHCAEFDANGNTVDSGSVCANLSPPGGSATQWQYNTGSGLGGLVGTSAIPQSGWTVINCSTFCNYNDFSSAFQSLAIGDDSSLNWRLVTQSLASSTSYTMTATLRCTHQAVASQDCGIYISDGTKLEGLEVLDQSTVLKLRVETMNSVTSDKATIHGGTTQWLVGDTATLRIVGDATHRTFYYWASGSFTQFYQENIGTWLTETTGGFGGVSEASSNANWVNVELLYWSLTSP